MNKKVFDLVARIKYTIKDLRIAYCAVYECVK